MPVVIGAQIVGRSGLKAVIEDVMLWFCRSLRTQLLALCNLLVYPYGLDSLLNLCSLAQSTAKAVKNEVFQSDGTALSLSSSPHRQVIRELLTRSITSVGYVVVGCKICGFRMMYRVEVRCKLVLRRRVSAFLYAIGFWIVCTSCRGLCVPGAGGLG